MKLHVIGSNKIWVFNPFIKYTHAGVEQVQTGCKVFYSSDNAIIPQLLTTRGSPEELSFPETVFDSLGSILRETTEYMPTESQDFQGWKVGILPTL
jgi:hypothetical protein